MSNPSIKISIDVTKLDKARFIVGEKGTYADLVLIPTPNSKLGDDYLVKQHMKKELDPTGRASPILGNGRIQKEAAPGPIPF